jgi:hypothetical protein
MDWLKDTPLDRYDRETARANAALHDYALMGPGRSLARLLAQYSQQPAPPTTHITTLKQWSARYDWARRVAAWDRLRNREAEDAILAARHSLALGAGAAARALLAAVVGDDPVQARIAGSDLLNRIGIVKSSAVPLQEGPHEPDQDWLERLTALFNRVVQADDRAQLP